MVTGGGSCQPNGDVTNCSAPMHCAEVLLMHASNVEGENPPLMLLNKLLRIITQLGLMRQGLLSMFSQT